MTIYQCTCGYSFSANAASVCPDCKRPMERSVPYDEGAYPTSEAMLGPSPANGAAALFLPLGLTAVLVPAWILTGITYQADLLGAIASPWMLVAMALMLGVRAGCFNLSVWGAFSAGSATTWLLIAKGTSVPLAVAIAALAGGTVGFAQGLIVRRSRATGVVVTLIVGMLLMSASRWIVKAAALERLPTEALGAYSGLDIRLLLAGSVYILSMLILLVVDGRNAVRGHRTRATITILPALTAGGALAAIGGATLLLGHSAYTPKTVLVSDFSVVAAVVLCGAWVWRARGGTLLAGMLLPVGLLVATIWKALIWGTLRGGDQLAMPILTVMAFAVTSLARRPRVRPARLIGLYLTGLGTLITAAGAYWYLNMKSPLPTATRILGTAVWLAGFILAVAVPTPKDCPPDTA